MSITENAPIRRYESGAVSSLDDTLVTERHVAIELCGEELIRTTCSPGRMREWVTGYLFSEGRIAGPEDVAAIHEENGRFAAALANSAPHEPATLEPVESDLAIDPDALLIAARTVIDRAEVFRQTGGTHAMAILCGTEIVSLAEDISRTCALEKALGEAILKGVDFGQSFAFLSSRVPSRMIAKLARCSMPIVVAISAPTIDAVRLAEELNLCLCGFVRGNRLNVYAHDWRVGL